MIGSCRPEQCQSYNPLREIPLSLISSEGLVLARCNPNLSPETIEKLKETERKLWEKKPALSYLLSEHDAQIEYRRRFVENGEAGKALISSIIADNPDQSLAEVIARFSIDTNTLFIHSLIWITDYYKSQNCLYLYIKRRDGSYHTMNWEPKLHASIPPKNIPKISSAKLSLSGDVNAEKGNLIATLEITNGNISAAAELLAISRPGFVYRLRKYGYMKDDSSLDYDKIERDQKALEEDAPEGSKSLIEQNDSITDIKRMLSKSVKRLTRTQVREALISNEYNLRAAASALSIGKINMIELLKEYYPDALSSSGCPASIACEVYERYGRNKERTCTALNISAERLAELLGKRGNGALEV